MWLFISGFVLGGICGAVLMCILQINEHFEIIKQYEDEK